MADGFTSQEPGGDASQPEGSADQVAKRRRHIALYSILASVLVITVVSVIAFKVLSRHESAKPKDVKNNASVVTARPEKKVTVNEQDKRAESREDTETEDAAIEVKQLFNLLIVGLEEAGGGKRAKGILLAKIDLLNTTVQAINIPERTYIKLSDTGYGQIGGVHAAGIESTKKAIEGLLKVQIDNYVVMRQSDFDYLLGENSFKVAFDRAAETDFAESEKKAYSREIAKVDIAKTSVVPLPVKYMSVNGEPYYEPNNEEISRLLEALWGIKLEIEDDTARVIVLNGCGLPGVGNLVADKLSANGYMVVEIKNAGSFDYTKTRIVAYKKDFVDEASEIRKILRVGDVIHHAVYQDVAEIAIIIGKDFKPTN